MMMMKFYLKEIKGIFLVNIYLSTYLPISISNTLLLLFTGKYDARRKTSIENIKEILSKLK
jgi:hypothetical protein